MTVPRNAFPRSYVASTIAIVALSIVSSLLGPFRPGHYTDPSASLARTRAEDLVILAVAVPADIVPATLAGTTPAGIREFGPEGAVTYVFDLGLLVPSYAIGAHLLRRDHEWGFVTAGILLVLGALMAPTLSAITAIDLRGGVAMTSGTIVGTILPPVLVGAFVLGNLSALGGRADERDANRRSVDT